MKSAFLKQLLSCLANYHPRPTTTAVLTQLGEKQRVYNALLRLRQLGLVTSNPDPADQAHRRRVYRLTPAGVAAASGQALPAPSAPPAAPRPPTDAMPARLLTREQAVIRDLSQQVARLESAVADRDRTIAQLRATRGPLIYARP